MTIILPLIIILSAVIIGLSVALPLVHKDWKPSLETKLFSFACACGLGIGSTSAIFLFLWSLAKVNFATTAFVFLTLALIVFGVALRWYRQYQKKKNSCDSEVVPVPAQPGKATSILKCSTLALFVANMVAFVYQCGIRPHGDFDAMMDWNLKARFLMNLSGNLQQSLPVELFWSHPEYPLLLPFFNATMWVASKTQSVFVTHITAFIFTFATSAIVWCTVSLLKGRDQANLATIVLLTTPFFVLSGTMLIADTPTEFYITATTACILLTCKQKMRGTSLIVLAGLLAGLSAWTKREGILFILALVGSATLLNYNSPKQLLSSQLKFLAGTIPGATCFVSQKLAWPAMTRWAMNYFKPEMLLDWLVYLVVFQFFTIQLITFGQWRISPLPMLLLYWFYYKDPLPRDSRSPSLQIALSILLMVLAYFFIFITFGRDAAFPVAGSAHRVFIQLWPSLIMVFFLNCKTPLEILYSQPITKERSPVEEAKNSY